MRFFGRQGRTLLFAAMVVVGAVCVSNGQSKPPTLVGQWIFADGHHDSKTPDKIELFSGGNGVMDDRSLTWTVENKRLMLLTSSVGIAADYKVSGYELVLTYDNGKSTIFVKKGMFEEYNKKKKEQAKKDAERAKKDAEQRFGKTSSYFTDSRNGQRYRAVTIGRMTWMAENLNYEMGKSWCYGNDESNCRVYGRLYDWNTAKTACPTGWNLPSSEEWNYLAAVAGSKALKSIYGWDSNGNGTDTYGFSALPGGHYFEGSSDNVGKNGDWWTTSVTRFGSALHGNMSYNDNDVSGNYLGNPNVGYSVRCLLDEKMKEEERIKVVTGGRSRASIQRVVMQNMAALRYAYNKRLREKPGMSGKITVKFAIDEFGKVIFAQIVESTMSDSELETTVVSRVKSWNFEKIDKPYDISEVVYTFVFEQ